MSDIHTLGGVPIFGWCAGCGAPLPNAWTHRRGPDGWEHYSSCERCGQEAFIGVNLHNPADAEKQPEEGTEQ